MHLSIILQVEFIGKSFFFFTISQVEFAVHSQLWHLQSFSLQGSQSLELEATGLKSFYLGNAQEGRSRGRFVVLLEETEVVRCGWNDNGSSKFRHVLQEALPKGPSGATGT